MSRTTKETGCGSDGRRHGRSGWRRGAWDAAVLKGRVEFKLEDGAGGKPNQGRWRPSSIEKATKMDGECQF